MLSIWLRGNRHGKDKEPTDGGMCLETVVALSLVGLAIVYGILLWAQELLMPNHSWLYIMTIAMTSAVSLFWGMYSFDRYQGKMLIAISAVFFMALYQVMY